MQFDIFYKRIKQETDISTQSALAAALGVNRSAITQAKNRDAVPQKWLLGISRRFGISPDWLEFGTGSPRLPHYEESDMFFIPRVHAVLSAGGGSLEVESATIETLPFRQEWLLRKGNPDRMVLMNVAGDSMEPSIMSGDTVLVDQSHNEARFGELYAFGYEDSILVKRLVKENGDLQLQSDNPAYAPILIRGEESGMLRVIGKVVWMCRTLQ